MAQASVVDNVLSRYSPLYFQGAEPVDSDRRVVSLFCRWFQDATGGRPLLEHIADLGSVTQVSFDFDDFCSAASALVTDVANCLRDRPERVLAHLGLALVGCREALLPPLPPREHSITVRFTGMQPHLPLSNLKSNIVGKLISFTGYVVRVSSIQPMVTRCSFECPKCGAQPEVWFEDGKYAPPERCSNSQCRGRIFELRRETAVTLDHQRCKVQESDNSLADAGRVPRTVEVELTEGLVDAVIPGDLVTVMGIVKSVNADHAAGKAGKRAASSSLFLLYVVANSVTNNRGSSSHTTEAVPGAGQPAVASEGQEACHFSAEELREIRAIAMEPDPFAWVVGSICPSIFGHDHVKAGLALGLFGGSKPKDHSRERLAVRSDPHVLVVGDPGLGKSQMLRAAAAIAPRSVYISANTTTAAGLTVTVSKESGGGGDVVLEAGALVLSDQGVCCVDEFDKIGVDSHCLLEAMEQQQVSVAKSGIVASLSARCSVLAAANPVGGHYDSGKTINENLKMSAALLSRFDLVFILLDKPEESHDRQLSEYIMQAHRIGREAPQPGFGVSTSFTGALDNPGFQSPGVGENRIVEQLRLAGRRAPIHPDILRKYVMYARAFVNPRLTGEAATVLQGMYLKIRDNSRDGNSLPITTRQLESLVRLSQARAKIELRDTVTEADALDVVSLLEKSLMETFRTDSGSYDFGRRGMSLSKQVKAFVAELNQVAGRKGSALFQTQDLLEIATRMNLGVADFHGFLDILNEQTYLLKKGGRLWQLQTHTSTSASQSSQSSQRSRF